MQAEALEIVKAEPAITRRLTLPTLAECFIESQDVFQSSRETYSRQMKQFILWLEETGKAGNLDALQRQDILIFREHLQALRKSCYTVSGYMTLVRKFFEWLEAEKIFPNIARGVKGPKKTKGFRKDCLIPSQIREALNSIDQGTPEGLRDYALMNLMARTGLRTIEVARAQVRDLRQDGGEAVLWIQGKGRASKDDFVLLVKSTLNPLREYLATRGEMEEEAPLFASLSDRNAGEPLTTRSIRGIIKATLRRVNLNDRRLSSSFS